MGGAPASGNPVAFAAGIVKGHRKEAGELLYCVEKDGQRKWYKRAAVILSLEQGNRLREQFGLGPYEPSTPLTKAADISLGKQQGEGRPGLCRPGVLAALAGRPRVSPGLGQSGSAAAWEDCVPRGVSSKGSGGWGEGHALLGESPPPPAFWTSVAAPSDLPCGPR